MKIDLNMNEITSVENIISNVLMEKDFNVMNNLIQHTSINKQFLFPNSEIPANTTFISVKRAVSKRYLMVMTEEEFFKVVGAVKKGISKKSGKYQEYLYGHYVEAVRLQDEGYIADVLEKALTFKNNLNIVKKLEKNKTFAENWRKDFTEESAVELFKRKGNMRIVNIIKERAQ